jgi:hypothetical protein
VHFSFSSPQRCHERLRKSRERFVERFRHAGLEGSGSVVQDLMANEWEALQQEIPALRHVPLQLPSVCQSHSVLSPFKIFLLSVA